MAMMDLGTTGYLKGENAIAKTYAENSLKLIALKDSLESYLKKQEWMNYCNFFEKVSIKNLLLIKTEGISLIMTVIN
jgi:hypothetical protein